MKYARKVVQDQDGLIAEGSFINIIKIAWRNTSSWLIAILFWGHLMTIGNSVIPVWTEACRKHRGEFTGDIVDF